MIRPHLRVIAPLALALCALIACSSDGSDGEQTGNGDGDDTGGQGGSGDGDTTEGGDGGSSGNEDATGGGHGGSIGDTEGSGGDAGDNEDPPPDPECTRLVEIEAGKNYGSTVEPYDYSVFAVRLDLEVEPGTYTIRSYEDEVGRAYLFRDDDFVLEFNYDADVPFEEEPEQVVSVGDYFELDVRSQTLPDLSHLGTSLFNGCHAVSVVLAPQIQAGATFGPFELEDVVIDSNAAPGTYTFFAESGNSGTVDLYLDGALLSSLDYPWMTTVGGGESFVFEFPDVVSFRVTRMSGTSNLFALGDELFDGRAELVIE